VYANLVAVHQHHDLRLQRFCLALIVPDFFFAASSMIKYVVQVIATSSADYTYFFLLAKLTAQLIRSCRESRQQHQKLMSRYVVASSLKEAKPYPSRCCHKMELDI
jgi:hypothetical protein